MKRNADVMVWDNGGDSIDRFTVLIRAYKGWDLFAMSVDALAPNGFNQYVTTVYAFTPAYSWGNRVALKTLPKEVRKAINSRRSA